MIASNTGRTSIRIMFRQWPWLILTVVIATAAWHAFDFPDDGDIEFPGVERPTFSAFPPPAYRLAEPGDTIDRIAIYVSSFAIVIASLGVATDRYHRGRWGAALALALAGFWYVANPSPTFDDWHGIGWASMTNPDTPHEQTLALRGAAVLVVLVSVIGLGVRPSTWKSLWAEARSRQVAGLFALAGASVVARQIEFSESEPAGYWPRWGFVVGLIAFSAALVRLLPRIERSRVARLGLGAGIAAVWFGIVVGGVWLTWYHRPLERLRAVVPGKIYMSAMPTKRGLEIAQARHHFKTIINLFPEENGFQSSRLPDELAFAEKAKIHYVGSPSDVASSNDFLSLTLRLAEDPKAWPILVHCHACMDRTPAWVGIYRFVVEGRPLDEIMRFIEQHRGYRPKASVTLLYNRVLPRLAADRFATDPTAALLVKSAHGIEDPYFERLKAEQSHANLKPAECVSVDTAAAQAFPSLTPRR